MYLSLLTSLFDVVFVSIDGHPLLLTSPCITGAHLSADISVRRWYQIIFPLSFSPERISWCDGSWRLPVVVTDQLLLRHVPSSVTLCYTNIQVTPSIYSSLSLSLSPSFYLPLPLYPPTIGISTPPQAPGDPSTSDTRVTCFVPKHRTVLMKLLAGLKLSQWNLGWNEIIWWNFG